MGFSVFFFVAWLVSVIFAVIQKKISLLENTFIILIILIINVNWSWIIFEEFKFIKITNEPINYTAFLLHRSITIPLILVTQLNFLLHSKSRVKSLLTILGSISLLALMSTLSLYYNITHFTRWNFAYEILYFIALHLIAYYSYKLFRKFVIREVKFT